MKKNNNATSQRKVKRSLKNKKRLSHKITMSKFERKQKMIRDNLLTDFFVSQAVAAEAAQLANKELTN